MLIVFDADDLLAEFLELVEATAAGDREDEEESLACLHVQFSGTRISSLVCLWVRISCLMAAERDRSVRIRHMDQIDLLNCSVPAVSRLQGISTDIMSMAKRGSIHFQHDLAALS